MREENLCKREDKSRWGRKKTNRKEKYLNEEEILGREQGNIDQGGKKYLKWKNIRWEIENMILEIKIYGVKK